MHSLAAKFKDHSSLLPQGKEYGHRPPKDMNECEQACVHQRELGKSRTLGISPRERGKKLITKHVGFESQIHCLLALSSL